MNEQVGFPAVSVYFLLVGALGAGGCRRSLDSRTPMTRERRRRAGTGAHKGQKAGCWL